MNHFTVLLLTCVFVNVSADLMEYIRAVSLANRLMKLASGIENDVVRSKNVENGLEYVIKSIVCENFHTLDRMNYMIAVPDFAPLNSEREIIDAIGHQGVMGIEISHDLNFDVLDRHYLKELAEERRRLTGPALKNIIRRVIDRYEHGVSLLGLCRLIALLMSTKLPSSNKKDFKTGSNGTCTVWDGSTAEVYREIEGTWWQVSFNDINNRVQLLKTQL
ncbi:uncharacterized protein LOC126846171 isoform X2 [Adelges cooleyi]|uniref:uncharacterized protein LOC126846171 isoform X2 n=1 Tax=Adelges cooleyi TaxID=133065 RepID=UPI0021807E91|nr:uncharacterized protein LOC126846171 isoform X2 [Adelges cooleyi]